MNISVVIPCYNEERTIKNVLFKILNSREKIIEIIIVDDYSTDGSRKIIEEFEEKDARIKKIFHEKNLGKGAALRSAFKVSKGEIIIIQDADEEYDPDEYYKLIKPFLVAGADVVYGSRFLGAEYVRLHFFWHYLANKILTLVCNLFTNLNMTDMETGMKAFKSSAIRSISLVENDFRIEPEITIKLSKQKLKFFEVSISYNGRSYEEGKKIGLSDAFKAFFSIFKHGIF